MWARLQHDRWNNEVAQKESEDNSKTKTTTDTSSSADVTAADTEVKKTEDYNKCTRKQQ